MSWKGLCLKCGRSWGWVEKLIHTCTHPDEDHIDGQCMNWFLDNTENCNCVVTKDIGQAGGTDLRR